MRTNLRVAAIILYKGKLLTTKMTKNRSSYYVLPGGGVEMEENIYEAIKREVKEETNLDVLKLKLIYIKELKNKEMGRGVEFYFYVEEYGGELKKGFDPEEKESLLEDIELLDLENLDKIIFYPKELISQLSIDKEDNFSSFKYLGLKDYP
jgi:ADP-ribose pyrophosphatase YjhB (NUDIX family)